MKIEIPKDMEDWIDYAEFNLDFEDTKAYWDFKVYLTNEELFLLIAWALTQKKQEMKDKKISVNKCIKMAIKDSGAFRWNVDFFGNRFEKTSLLSAEEKKILKFAKNKEHKNQTKMLF